MAREPRDLTPALLDEIAASGEALDHALERLARERWTAAFVEAAPRWERMQRWLELQMARMTEAEKAEFQRWSGQAEGGEK